MNRSLVGGFTLGMALLTFACGGPSQPANEPNSTNKNPSAQSGTIEEMTNNTNSPDSVSPDSLKASGGESSSAQ